MKYFAFLFLSVSFGASAQDCLDIDGVHSNIAFEIEQSGNTLTGNFERIGGEICIAGDVVTRVDAWLDTASAETGAPQADAMLEGKDFFAVVEFPRLRFESRSIGRTRDGFVARGTLTMKGISRPFDMPFTLEKAGDSYRASGETILKRLEFNIGTGEWADTERLSDEVAVTYSIIANDGTS